MKIIQISDIHYKHSHNSAKKWVKFFRKRIKNIDFDAFCVVGDIASTQQEEIRDFFKMLRSLFPDKKIFWNKGNHCFWSSLSWFKGKYNVEERQHNSPSRYFTYQNILDYHEKINKEFDLIHLDGDFYELDKDIVLMGFDGWYGYTPNTNDELHLPPELKDHSLLRNKAHNDLDRILDSVDKYYNDDKVIKICMSHFPPYSRNPQYRHMIANENYLTFICEKFDYFLIGHSHKDEEWKFKDCQIVNCGADYDKPQAKLIDIRKSIIETIV